MNGDVIQLAYWQVGMAYVFVIVVLIMLRRRGIRRETTLLLASIRMTLQLVAVGFVLMAVFGNPHPLITTGIVLLMIGFAVYTLFRKFKRDLSPALRRVIAISVPLGTVPVLAFFLWLVIGITPLYDPQYVIPITGMIVGNSMTGISLGIHTLVTRFKNNRMEIEEALALGATPKQASDGIVNDAFDAAIMPTLNSMLGMGIIFLPGMMTGQILSGVDPTLAILYQIAIMLGILGGVSVTTYVFLALGVTTFFTDQQQLA